MIKTIIMGLLVTGVVGTSPAFASGNHKGMDAHHGAMNGGMHHEMGKGHMNGEMTGQMKDHMNGMFFVRKDIDGYQVSFHIMKAPEGMQKHGGAHHFMFKAEKNGKALTNILVNSKVTHPNGQSESKMMMRMGDWYMAGYDIGHPGTHQIMVLFKTSDGKKHFGGIEYQAQGVEK
ncbi:MAG: hypothetical protein Q9M24_07755 [Mariprofundaceae bacterium]|nr:hypothetical protein [Mariprofundaceae bacterium]